MKLKVVEIADINTYTPIKDKLIGKELLINHIHIGEKLSYAVKENNKIIYNSWRSPVRDIIINDYIIVFTDKLRIIFK